MEKEVPQTSRNFPKKTKKIIRHHLPDRIFHWVMAVCMLVLLFTGFLAFVLSSTNIALDPTRGGCAPTSPSTGCC